MASSHFLGQVGIHGPHRLAYWSQEGSQTPDDIAAAHLAGHSGGGGGGTHTPQMSLYLVQLGSHTPVSTAL